MVHRNGLRLLKLVNTLLDFSRIEAGRVRAALPSRPTSPPTPRISPALPLGLRARRTRLVVDCRAAAAAGLCRSRHVGEDRPQPALQRVQVHASTARSRSRLPVDSGRAGTDLSSDDTGVGIPAQRTAAHFERFHRVEGQRGRTHGRHRHRPRAGQRTGAAARRTRSSREPYRGRHHVTRRHTARHRAPAGRTGIAATAGAPRRKAAPRPPSWRKRCAGCRSGCDRPTAEPGMLDASSALASARRQ